MSAAGEFLRFADGECRGYCRFYEEIARHVAADPEVLALTDGARPGQRLPNLLLGSVRRLLLDGGGGPLADHYARAATEGPTAAGEPAWEAFRAFCLERAPGIRTLVATRLVQTNEVGRCTALQPAFALLAEAGGAPLGLVELGCSAGLLLLADRCRVRYALDDGTATERGDPASPLRLACALPGAPPPALPATAPRVALRVGIDREPVDLRDGESLLWLRALLWPDRPEREANLIRAADLLRSHPPDLRRGDAGALLPAALEDIPAGVLPVAFHCAAWGQFPGETRRAVEEALAAESRRRPLGRVSLESSSGRIGDLRIEEWRDGRPRLLHRARAHLHGISLEWHPAA